MKKLFLSILLLPLFLCSFADSFSIDQKIITESAGCSDFSHFTNYITNNGTSTISLGWYVIENTLPLTVCWTYIICDMKQCYSGIPKDGSDNMGDVYPGHSVVLFDLGINTNGYSGSGILKLYVYSIGNPADGDTVVYTISGCDSGSACPPISIKENMSVSSIHIYPNPVSDVIHIYNSNNSRFTNVSLFDLYGKKVNGLENIASSGNIMLNVVDLPAGIYFVYIQSDDILYYIKKIIKE